MAILSSVLHSFRWKLCLMLVPVIVGDWLFFQRAQAGGNFGFFAFSLLGVALLGQPAIWRDWRAWIAAALAGVFALALVMDPGLLAWSLFWVAIGIAVMIPATGRFDDGWRWAQRLLLHGLRSLVLLPITLERIGRAGRRRSVSRLSLRASLPVLALPLTGSVVIVALFARANPIIGDMLASILMPDLSDVSVLRAFLWIILLTMTLSVLRPKAATRLLTTFDGSGDSRLPGVSLASVRLSLILFNLLFAVQNMLDAAYLWGITQLPQGMTLAQYAHRGAYPLIVTALLAALFVLITLRPGSRMASVPLIRRLLVVWIAQNLFLVASSILRTLDYIGAYSLTCLRIAALAWMLLVAVGLVLICWRMLRGHSAGWLINANLVAAGVVLTLGCFVDMGEIAARWNVRHARDVGGTGVQLDLCYLGDLGDSALLPLIELERRGAELPPGLRIRVQVVRSIIMNQMQYEESWTWRNAQRLEEARRMLVHVPQLHVPSGERDCAGSLIPPSPPPSPAVETAPAVPATPTRPSAPAPAALTGAHER